MDLTGKPLSGRVVALVPAHNEESSIAGTIESVLAQQRVPDVIVIICDNCTDNTQAVASQYPVTVVATVNNSKKKVGAMNWAWAEFAQDADTVICLDADTTLPPNAVSDWAQELADDPRLGGSSSRFTMLGGQFLVRLQRAEFFRWSESSLRRGWTSVLAGTGCAIRGSVLRELAARDDRTGPWTSGSLVEDFELTYQVRRMGYKCHVSPTVPAYTDAMRTVRSLWAQRMKWQVGTASDLLAFGFNRLTRLDWVQQAAGLLSALTRALWILSLVLAVALGAFRLHPIWFAIPVFFVGIDVIYALRVPGRDKMDILIAASLFPQEFFSWMRAAWFTVSWVEVLAGKITGRHKDRWSLQYSAEK